MLHVGRRKDLGACAAGDLVLEQAGGAVFRLHLLTGCALERRCRFVQRTAQAAGGIEQHRLGGGCRDGHDRCQQNESDARNHHAPGTVALGKNSCSPLIL
jgi:hypothetical protein